MALAIAAVLAAIDARFGWLLASGAAAYAVATLAVSAKIAADERDLAQLFLMPLTFGILHTSYGAGSLWGLAEATMTRLRAAFGRGDASN